MSVMAAHFELALRNALEAPAVPKYITVHGCLAYAAEIPIDEALQRYAERRRRGLDERIIARRPDLLRRVADLTGTELLP